MLQICSGSVKTSQHFQAIAHLISPPRQTNEMKQFNIDHFGTLLTPKSICETLLWIQHKLCTKDRILTLLYLPGTAANSVSLHELLLAQRPDNGGYLIARLKKSRGNGLFFLTRSLFGDLGRRLLSLWSCQPSAGDVSLAWFASTDSLGLRAQLIGYFLSRLHVVHAQRLAVEKHFELVIFHWCEGDV